MKNSVNSKNKINPNRSKIEFENYMINRLTDGDLFPPEVSFEVNSVCNVKCIMCDSHRKKPLPDKVVQSRQLTPEFLKDALVNTDRLSSVILSSGDGEPFLNKKLPEIVSFLKTKDAHIIVITNGTMINKRTSERIINSGLDELLVSLHGTTKDVAEGIMVGSRFDRVVEGIKYLTQLKKINGSEKPIIKIVFVGMKRNIHQLRDMAALAKELGVSEILLQSHIVRDLIPELEDDSLVNHPELLRAEYKKAMDFAEQVGIKIVPNQPYAGIIDPGNIGINCELDDEFEESGIGFLPDGKTRLCMFPFKKPYIGLRGDVKLCCSASGRDIVMGNLKEGGFAAVWNNKKYTELRKSLMTGDNIPKMCRICQREPITDPEILVKDVASYCYRFNKDDGELRTFLLNKGLYMPIIKDIITRLRLKPLFIKLKPIFVKLKLYPS